MEKRSSGSVKVFYPSLRPDELVTRLRVGARSLSQVLPLHAAILFGSWANSRATAFSDIDLLVVYAGPPRDDAFALVRRHVSIRGLEPHVYSAAEASEMHEQIRRMTRDGVPIFPDCRATS